MPGLLPHVDEDGLLEYSVVYTDHALNHMSRNFQGVMRDISRTCKSVYGAKSAIVVPGSGTFGVEAVARQFATAKKALVIRNGWFSYRWTQMRVDGTQSTSDACDLRKWLQVMETCEAGGHAYHATLPTDALTTLRDVMREETETYGLERVRAVLPALPAVRAQAA